MATHLTPEEREVISQMLAQGLTRRAIARALQRDVSTLYRELRRNGHRGLYCAVHAQACAAQRRREARRKSRKMQRPELRHYVQSHLRKCWSPEQIAGRLPRDYPENPALRISHQTIYMWLATDDHRRRWIEAHNVSLGARVATTLPEIGVQAEALVTAMEPCPPLAAGDGAVVIGRYVTRQVASVARVLFLNGEELVGKVDYPVWSADRYDWIGLGALKPGEHVRSRDGLLVVLSGPTLMIVGEVLSSERLEFDAPNEALHVSLQQVRGK